MIRKIVCTDNVMYEIGDNLAGSTVEKIELQGKDSLMTFAVISKGVVKIRVPYNFVKRWMPLEEK